MRWPGFIFICFLLLLLFRSFPQGRNESFTPLYQDYAQADGLYLRALHLAQSASKNEAVSEELNRQALGQYRQLLQRTPEQPLYDSLRFFALLKMGELEHYFDSLSQALHFYRSAVVLKERLPRLSDTFLFKPYLFSGNISFSIGQTDSAALFFKKAEAIQDRSAVKLAESERLYNDLGVLYYQAGNYIQAKNYFKKATAQLPPQHPYYRDLLVNYTINFASALSKNNLYDSAALIYKSLLPYRQHLNELYNNIGLMDLYAGRAAKALESFSRVNYSNRFAIGLSNDKARAWMALGKYDLAKANLQNAEAQHQQYDGNQTSTDYGLSLKTYGDLEEKTGNPEEAVYYYQQGLHQFYPSYRDSSIFHNPEKFSGVFSYIHLFETLVAKAEACYHVYLQTRRKDWARAAINAYSSASVLIDYIERTYDSDEARLFLAGTRYKMHGVPIALPVELYQATGEKAYLEVAYSFDQQNKASVLAFREEQSGAKIATPVRQQESALKTEITRLSLQAQQLSDDTAIARLNETIGEKEIALGRVEDEIARTYTAVQKKLPSIAALQKDLLDASTQLLSYHLSDSLLFIFSISTDSFSCVSRTIDAHFRQSLQNYIASLQHDEGPADERDGKLLYELLLKNVITPKCKRLIIIPDDELCYLPFEALVDGGHYLIEKYSVQYQYSTALLKKEGGNLEHASVISFAPFTSRGFEKDAVKLEQLPRSAEEAQGRKITGAEATKEKFLTQVSNYDIVHLATHAVANDSLHQLSYIAFAPWNHEDDYALYTQEIYNLSLQRNKLIILSACETAQGKLIRGEGVMSLSRAFAYAGCPNIVTSLWKANDASTAFITSRFHEHLSEGSSIDEALRLAKTDFLQSRDINPRMKTPAYWAHLIFVGNYQPASNSFPLLPVAGIGLVILAGGLIFLKKRRKN